MAKEESIKCIVGGQLREVINEANRIEIKKENIVSILAIKDQVYLVYYG